jgi:glucose-6-phosphate isomerase
MWAIYEGVKIDYKKNNLPFLEVRLEPLSAYELGQFMQYQMMTIMYLAQLMDVNAFDQPDVENYKKETKQILDSKH